MTRAPRIGFGLLFLASMTSFALGCGGDDASTSAATSGPSGGTSSSSASSSSSGDSGSGSSSSGAGGSSAGPQPDAAFLPKATGPCPEFTQGTNTVTPDGKARDVEVWISDAAKTKDGPLIFYWHGTGSSPVNEPPYGIGTANIAAINDEGGIVVAPHHDPNSGQWPWYLTTGSGPEDDLRVADEVVACAIEKLGIDIRRIHSMGMSAGGLQTTQLSYRRSGYIASVVTYSGGLLGDPPNQDPSNKFAAMIFHGGQSDKVVINFQPISEAYRDDLRNDDHFAFTCDHGMGHSIPTDAVNSVQQFFKDHPFGTDPSPYVTSLPGGFPAYCSL